MTSGRQEGQGVRLAGMRTVLLPDDPRFPAALRVIPRRSSTSCCSAMESVLALR